MWDGHSFDLDKKDRRVTLDTSATQRCAAWNHADSTRMRPWSRRYMLASRIDKSRTELNFSVSGLVEPRRCADPPTAGRLDQGFEG